MKNIFLVVIMASFLLLLGCKDENKQPPFTPVQKENVQNKAKLSDNEKSILESRYKKSEPKGW